MEIKNDFWWQLHYFFVNDILIHRHKMRGALLLMWAWKLMEEDNKNRRQEEQQADEDEDPRFVSLLDSAGRRRCDRRIARPSLLLPEESPWSMILNRGNDACMITATGLTNLSLPCTGCSTPTTRTSPPTVTMGRLFH